MTDHEDQQPQNPDSGSAGASDPLDPSTVRQARTAPKNATEIELGTDLDPAHRALAEALRFSYRILQFSMVALILYFFLSTSFQTVDEREEGLQITFGSIQTSEPLAPGAHASWPAPIGEFLLVLTAPQTIELNEEFWPHLSNEEKNLEFKNLPMKPNQGLIPGEDGSVVTGDHNLAHTRWSIQYHISDARRFIETISESENIAEATSQAGLLVRKSVERAVVHAAAQTSLDDIISVSTTFKSRVQTGAQELLNQIGAGIVIDNAFCTAAKPPRVILEDYQAVTTASSQTNSKIERAHELATQTLNMMAGASHHKLALMIQIYDDLSTGITPNSADLDDLCRIVTNPDELRTAARDPQQFLEQIDAVLVSLEVGGEVANIIALAQRDATQLVSTLKAETSELESYYAQYQKNPLLLKTELWRASIDRIYNDVSERFFLSPETKLIEIRLNRDPQFHKKIREAKNQREAFEEGLGSNPGP